MTVTHAGRRETVNSPESSHQLLLQQLVRGDEIILIDAVLHLTKTPPAREQALLRRLFLVEHAVNAKLKARLGFKSRKNIFKRYALYDREIDTAAPLVHVPVEAVAGSGLATSGQNVFMFAPAAFGLTAGAALGLEFIDVWRSMFSNIVLPAANRVFDPQTANGVNMLLGKLDTLASLASVLHEIGHRAGPYRVSPAPRPENCLAGFGLDALGELSTDCMMIWLHPELSDLALWVMLHRLLYWGRRGFSARPQSGRINEDNDAWLSAFLWRHLSRAGVLEQTDRGWHLHSQRLPEVCGQVIAEIDALYRPGNAAEQERVVREWMESVVSVNARGQFQLPPELREVYSNLSNLPEYPPFKRPFELQAVA